MIINEKISEQMQDFCDLRTPDEIRENTRMLTSALVYSDFFESMHRKDRCDIIFYLQQVEDILLSVHHIEKDKLYERA